MADPKPSPSVERRRPRRGFKKPASTDVRIIISLPALVSLLCIAMGLAYYKIFFDFTNALEETYPNVNSTEALSEVLLVLLLFTGVGFVVSIVYAWTVQQPIRLMADAVASIARGEMNQNVEFKGAFELDQLGKSFNSMVNFVGSMIEERDTYLNEGVQAGLMVVDFDGRIRSVSTTALTLLGVSREQCFGRRIQDLRREHPDCLPTFLDFCLKRLEGDASVKPVEVDLEARRPGDAPLSVAYQFLKDYQQDLPAALMFHFRDRSRRENLNELFHRTDQLAALGAFTLGLSHELRNPLAALKGSTQLLSESIGADERQRRYIRHIIREVDRMDVLVRELYDFSHSPAVVAAPQDLNGLAGEALATVLDTLPEARIREVEIVKKFDRGLPALILQRSRVQRAIVNVVKNAFEHMSPGARLTLHSYRLYDSPQAPLVLDVHNTGSAIPSEEIGKVFEPFHSTRPGGTGLGLAIAYQITAQNQGSLSAENRGGGVLFRFVFRRLALPPEEREAEDSDGEEKEEA